MIFTSNLFNRLLRNVKPGVAYFPIIFSEYDPDHTGIKENHFNITEYGGFWREYGYGMVAMYNFDFKISGGFDLNIKGWGLEDVHLIKNALRRGINVHRSNDPDLIHIFHHKHCSADLQLSQQSGCLKTKASHIGPQLYHYNIIKQRPFTIESKLENILK